MALRVRRFDGIAIVPFIDIMLVLTVLTLSLSTFISQGEIPVDLPNAKAQEYKQVSPLIITVSKEGEIYIDSQKTNLELLEKTILSKPKETPIVLKADKKSSFESFTAVFSILSANAFKKVSIVTLKG